jgi:hypothetical protein
MSNNVINFSDIPAAKGCDTIPGGNKISNLKISMEPVPMPEKNTNLYGIEETKDVVSFLAATGNAINESLADDGKISVGEYTKFISPVGKLFPAVTGFNQVIQELGELNDDEKKEIIDQVKAELDINENVEAIIEKCLNVSYGINEIASLIKAARVAKA